MGGAKGKTHPSQLAHARAGNHVEIRSVLGVKQRHLADFLVIGGHHKRDNLQTLQSGGQLQYRSPRVRKKRENNKQKIK